MKPTTSKTKIWREEFDSKPKRVNINMYIYLNIVAMCKIRHRKTVPLAHLLSDKRGIGGEGGGGRGGGEGVELQAKPNKTKGSKGAADACGGQ